MFLLVARMFSLEEVNNLDPFQSRFRSRDGDEIALLAVVDNLSAGLKGPEYA